MTAILQLIKSEEGQDLIEYTLLLAFVLIASAALYINAGGSITGIWTMANSRLDSGVVAAGS